MKKSKLLRNLLLSDKTEFILEAHNGVSAQIVEEAGFSGIWASGLAISASMGIRDCNEASWTQVLEILEFMSDATSIPILIDADTGYGNFNNVRRLVKKLEKISIGGLCIEDKVFPKLNSYVNSQLHSLVSIEEFAGKIKAAKDAQKCSDFCVIARTESLVVGQNTSAALERAEAYYKAGADAVLVHSKANNFDEISNFMTNWKYNCPVVIVPTSYSSTPTAVFQKSKISMVIWANHLIRSCIKSMQMIAKEINNVKSVTTIEDKIVPLQEIFRLQRVDELKAAEKIYLPK